MQREKRTKSGRLMEIDFYPIFGDGRRIPTRAPRTRAAVEAQKKYNQLQATKKFVRLVNCNFDSGDYLLHPTYAPQNAPADEDSARRDIVNYLRRVKNRRAAEARRLRRSIDAAETALDKSQENAFLSDAIQKMRAELRKIEEPLKYIYVIEKQVYKRGIYAGLVNYHFHIVISGGLSASVMEDMWQEGVRVNCDRYQPDRFGPEAAARYFCKDPQGTKRFCYSRNLIQPVSKVRDGKVTDRTVSKMATERVDDRQYWEKRYPGYRFIRCYNRQNPYNGYWYISAIMYRTDGEPPRWDADDWITTDA